MALGSSAAAAAKSAATGRESLLRIPAEGRPKRDCWIHLPPSYDKTKPYPLVLVLHPAGLTGVRFTKLWGEAADRTEEFVVAGPECKDQRRRMWKFADEADLMATARKVMATYSIDPSRVLLTGFSQGGVYAYTFGLRNPHVFRAIAPVGGALSARPSPEAEKILERARGMGVYIVHGAADSQIPVERARASRDRLERAGFQVSYREIPLLGHFYPEGECDRIWRWFKALTTPPPPPPPPKDKKD